ncbi:MULTISPECIES: DUF808 domain-containing protein [unclassified Siphonobacter]|uniref:DUF808 domain-containing protein n=1 Tax=unclassified Siphonobacter TaxID=2635712 RepID=UPI000CBA1444|nr:MULTISPECIES: DUF808 domain-containing protein [unclassified Siphonobacter]MDQ1087691.1 putative DNA repair protein MutK [Siphonobacter sp. SORGH_AS_1065]MDR6193838.1 putative DNA repair protein MutK [Siphonobacter sp. SORGH_AS_0500]PKK38005.1 ABC transporter [Siphonobacter sp. SORGH_AS_0500]
MASGLLALLDDVAALVKASAASLDDVPTQVAKTTSKVSGVVIDDTAVTPKYVVGLDPSRELAIIFKIAKKSLINKVFLLTPVVLLLGFYVSWVIPYILMVGGAYLCFEGYEKVHSMFSKHEGHDESDEDIKAITPEELEKVRVDSAVRTDLILSAEIMVITFGTVTGQPLFNQIIVMLIVAVVITVGVYGAVGVIVKMDDVGVNLAGPNRPASIQKFGRGLVKAMPKLLTALGYIGTVAMLWVGAEIIVHGVPFLHHALEHFEHAIPGAALAWIAKALVCAVGGVILGFVIDKILSIFRKK